MNDNIIKKRELALNSSSRPILQALLCEYDHDIREGLAKNPRCPSNLLYEHARLVNAGLPPKYKLVNLLPPQSRYSS